MINPRAIAMSVFFGIVVSTHGLEGQSLSQYRNFQLGANLASVSTLAGVAPAEAQTIHQRPAVLQDLEWRPSHWVSGSVLPSTDPVEKMAFSFYNDQLFRVVVDYGQERTDGMTDADMIAAISGTYGVASKRTTGRTAPRVVSQLEIESGAVLARWGDAEHAVALYRTALYGTQFRLIVTETRLYDLARKAAAQSTRLDAQEAPRREVDRQNKEIKDGRVAKEKARITNKAALRP